MIGLGQYLAFLGVSLLVICTPGQDTALTIRNTLLGGRRGGVATALGVSAGQATWTVATSAGLAVVLMASGPLFAAIRLAGAAYLVYLGVQRWRYAADAAAPQRAELGRVFAQGFLTQIINPKVAVFFVAFLPQFLDVSRPIAPQVAVLGAVYVAVAILVDTSYVIAASALSSRFMRSRAAQRRTSRIAATTYVGLGVAAAATGVKRP